MSLRPRERYLLDGPSARTDAELVALLLGTGIGGRSAQAIAEGLLTRFGSLQRLAQAEARALAAEPGVGPARAVRVHAALALARRVGGEGPPGEAPVLTPEDAARWFLPVLAGLATEQLHALYLDRQQRPLARRLLTSGADDHTIVDARQVMRTGLELRAAALILAHNHPSGVAEPSAADVAATRVVAQAGKVVGVRLVDHLVVAGGRWVSLAERGEVPA